MTRVNIESRSENREETTNDESGEKEPPVFGSESDDEYVVDLEGGEFRKAGDQEESVDDGDQEESVGDDGGGFGGLVLVGVVIVAVLAWRSVNGGNGGGGSDTLPTEGVPGV